MIDLKKNLKKDECVYLAKVAEKYYRVQDMIIFTKKFIEDSEG